MKNNQLKQTELKLKNHKHKDVMHDPKRPPHSIILRIISGLEWVEHIMDVMDLAIQCIEPLIAKVVMCMLSTKGLYPLVGCKESSPWVQQLVLPLDLYHLDQLHGHAHHQQQLQQLSIHFPPWESPFCADFGSRYGSTVQLTLLAHPLHQFQSIQWI